jgi:hypothetical protein
MRPYTVTDKKTGERTELIAPNRDAALKAYVRGRLVVVRAAPEPPPVETPDVVLNGPIGPVLNTKNHWKQD